MEESELKALLKELGLNKYEVNAYFTLIKQGPLTAGELASLSKVPQPRIYDVVRSLMSKGFVAVTSERPKKIVPLDPKEVLEAIEKNYIKKMELAKRELKAMYTPHESNREVIVVKSKTTLENYIKEAIKNVKYHLSLAIPSNFLEKVVSLLKEKNKEITVDLFVYGNEDVPKVADKIRVREVEDPIILIQDKALGIYAPPEAFKTRGQTIRGYALIIRDKNLLFMLDRYFYHALWPTGKLIYEKKGKLKLPKSYIHIRSLVEDIRNYNLIGNEIEVYGKFVKTGGPVHLTGKIVAFFESEGKVVSNITVETEKGEKYVIGGWNASLEDIEAELIILEG
ncbi:TrmB family transcriptional regulator [Thermococcus sibiricus]|uniref:Transcriptional regulator TrmB n=2 Tax=Thermococcus sibiricus TaxID=172049 RepID=C6A540_THESM|nr:TrmB family transcriptional regulator [Thermococcus sibiricus]ACS90735.1 Transcriptional regulator TrmB [Thermococcus sibiricus MM 739]KUK17506.1 MAG: Transcriptional regulator TrmB [Thermococcus sibiricus]